MGGCIITVKLFLFFKEFCKYFSQKKNAYSNYGLIKNDKYAALLYVELKKINHAIKKMN